MNSNREIVVDSFAGGGGASLGIKAALGRGPDVAINHDAASIAMHAANHPEAEHFTKDVWSVKPATVTKGRPVGLLWASPDCCHFSRAKGAKPLKNSIRSLAWVVVKWAAEVRPRVIILENVREFEDWGPLIQKVVNGKGQVLDDGSPVLIPDPTRKGHSFKRWAGRLRNLGYEVQWRAINAADFGAPTLRRRLFLIARCDGKPIEWPTATHCDPKKVGNKWDFDGRDAAPIVTPRLPWRTAAECIDWSIPCPSIFLTKKEARAWAKANGCSAPQRPLVEKTLRRVAMGVKRYVLDCAAPFIVQVNHGGNDFRGQGADEPLDTVTAKHGYGVIIPHITKFRGSSVGSGADEPLPTVTSGAGSKRPAGAAHAMGVVSAFLIPRNGEANGQAPRCTPVDAPINTITADANVATLVMPVLSQFHGQKADESRCQSFNDPDEPLHSVTAGGNHAALVYSFLVKYFGTAIGASLIDPMPTATGKDRFGLVTVQVNGEPYVIVDIGMRMLSPRELALAQGFPVSYILTGSKGSQVARIGNSVSPPPAEAIVRANYTPAKVQRKAKVS